MKMKKIGEGASRTVFLLEDGRIMKRPNYMNYGEKIGVGSAYKGAFEKLVELTKDDPKVAKVLELEKEGRELYSSCRNNFVEYMVSLLLNEEEKGGFALCTDIRVRRSTDIQKISVVGFYENAYTKKRCHDQKKYRKFEKRTKFMIKDLHFGNFRKGMVVDYAAIETH